MRILLALVIAFSLQNQHPGLSLPLLEQRIHDLVNTERIQRKLKPLRLNERFSKIARAHSEDMARRDFFDHVNPDGNSATQRAIAGGFPCRKDQGNGGYTIGVSENIFQNNLYSRVTVYQGRTTYHWNTLDEIARTTMEGWMGSPGHRANILKRDVEISGVGVAVAPNDKVYITQMFC
jgi:uncharacterized protein YkwD